LKSLEGAYVTLRPLTYAQFLHRRDLGGKVTIKGSDLRDVAGEVALMQGVVTEYEFLNCIVEHNLEDETGQLLQFPRDLGRLLPKVGEEISTLIDKMNQFEVDEGNSSNGSGPS
jgi:hypothetical protein